MKALDLLSEIKESRDFDGNKEYKIDEAIKELILVQQELDNLTESNKELLECLQYTQTKLEMLL